MSLLLIAIFVGEEMNGLGDRLRVPVQRVNVLQHVLDRFSIEMMLNFLECPIGCTQNDSYE
ncbi:MAG: hypothetical protein NT015_00995 [Alphaproteobacteria bacterium]|nr:hypothetical protein [Alphaproteobacteria bacterium]